MTYSAFIYLSIKIYNKINLHLDKKYFQSNLYYSLSFKLFMVASYISIISFIFFSNFFHREVFLICLMPLILKLNDEIKTFPFKHILILYLVKLIYSFIYSYFNINDSLLYIDNQRVFSELFLIIISIKSLIDFVLMVMISGLLIYNTKIFYSHFKTKFL